MLRCVVQDGTDVFVHETGRTSSLRGFRRCAGEWRTASAAEAVIGRIRVRARGAALLERRAAAPQKRFPGGFSCPQAAQLTRGLYLDGTDRARKPDSSQV